jgi:signal transduction histidine kinase
MNRGITTARLLSQRGIFDRDEIRRIDSLTTISLVNKTVQAYGQNNRRIYTYSDVVDDTLTIKPDILENTRAKGNVFFIQGRKEAVAYHYTDPQSDMVVITAAEDEDGKASLRNLFKILLVSFLVGNILVLVTGYFFSRGLLGPVRKIAEDVAEISAQNLARRIETGKTKDEWYHLAYTLNQLLNRLQESFDLQQRFISNASHELSTPLTSISSQLEVSLQRERDASEYRKTIQSIYQDVQHMGKLTQTLLEFAKASGSPGGLEINLLRIDEIILGLPSEINKLNSAYTVKVEFENMPEEEEKLLVFGNETLLLTATKNIVINACKYSENHNAVVKLSVSDHHVLIEVSDTGPGIPREQQEHIFQPFYRVDETRTAGGFGLGLSLAERIIKLHKGTISVQSEEGVGTRFLISLPAAHLLKEF